MLDRLGPIYLKMFSLSLNFLSNSSCFPTILIFFLFSPFKRASYLLMTAIAALGCFAFHTASFSSELSSLTISMIEANNSSFIDSISLLFFFSVYCANRNNHLQSFGLCIIPTLKRYT